MTQVHFHEQMARLTETYGKTAYGTERARLIWGYVKDLSESEFKSVVDHLIGSCRQAPLMTEFGEQVSLIREKKWQEEKRQHRNDATIFMSSLQGDEVRMICKNIRDRLNGNMPDEAFNSFVEHLGSFSKMKAAE